MTPTQVYTTIDLRNGPNTPTSACKRRSKLGNNPSNSSLGHYYHQYWQTKVKMYAQRSNKGRTRRLYTLGPYNLSSTHPLKAAKFLVLHIVCLPAPQSQRSQHASRLRSSILPWVITSSQFVLSELVNLTRNRCGSPSEGRRVKMSSYHMGASTSNLYFSSFGYLAHHK